LQAEEAEITKQSQFLSDIVRVPVPPFTKPPQPLSAAVLNWNDGTVRRIAEAIYADRKMPEGTLDNARLAVLADALEESGCQDVQILGHLRWGGDHVRGCWALDLVLGKT
jgi:hypothetical protein